MVRNGYREGPQATDRRQQRETLATALDLDEERPSLVYDLAAGYEPSELTEVILAQGDLIGVPEEQLRALSMPEQSSMDLNTRADLQESCFASQRGLSAAVAERGRRGDH